MKNEHPMTPLKSPGSITFDKKVARWVGRAAKSVMKLCFGLWGQ